MTGTHVKQPDLLRAKHLSPNKPTMLIMGVIILAFLSNGTGQKSSLVVLPTELQGVYLKMRIQQHFCQNYTGTCPSDVSSLRSLCCQNRTGMPNQCYKRMGQPMCMEANQMQQCEYEDAIICQYRDNIGSCIYSSSLSTQLFCVCKDDNGTWPNSDAQESQIRGSCSNDGPTTDGTESNPNLQTTMTMFTHSAASMSTAISIPTSSQQQPTTVDSQSSLPTTIMGSQSTAADGSGNVISIVLGVILSLVLLALILVLFHRWRGKLPSRKKKASQPRDPSIVELDEQTSDRMQLPQPLVLGSSEYSYAYDHWPQRILTPDTGEPKTGSNRYEPDGPGCSSSSATGNSTEAHQDHSYYEIGRSKDGETLQDRKYYELGGAQNMEKGSSGETPSDPQYFVLDRTRGDEELQSEDGGTIKDDLSPGDQSKQGDDHGYFALMPTTEPQTPGYEALQPRTSGYEDLQTRNPGYEALQVPTSSEGNDASSPGYDVLQPQTSGYEVVHVATSSEGNDASSPYDHLDNTIDKRSKKGGLQKNESDNHHYASLNG